MRETWAGSPGQEDPMEKEMAIHSSSLAWKIPWMGNPGVLQSLGSQRVGQSRTQLRDFILTFHFQCRPNAGNCIIFPNTVSAHQHRSCFSVSVDQHDMCPTLFQNEKCKEDLCKTTSFLNFGSLPPKHLWIILKKWAIKLPHLPVIHHSFTSERTRASLIENFVSTTEFQGFFFFP